MLIDPQDIEELSPQELKALLHDWSIWARPSQLPPDDPRSSNYSPDLGPNTEWEYWIALAGRGFGKALSIDTPILTSEGWKTMGTLTDSDQVYAPDGTLTPIITHPIRSGRECYRIIFDDHTTLVADEDHLHPVVHKRSGQRLILSTREMYQHQGPGRNLYHIPVCSPLLFPSQPLPLPLDPYLLGYWLGDGTSSQSRITVSLGDLPSLLSQLPQGLPYEIVPARRPTCATLSIRSIRARLKELDLLKNKHIPLAYLQAHFKDRVSVLQGMIDSDGSVTSKGVAQFINSNPQLIRDFTDLATGLGLKVTVRQRVTNSYGEKRISWVCRFKSPFTPARLPRKALRHLPPRSTRFDSRTIIKIEPVESVPVRCITVKHPSKLYLATRALIPTHNTRLGAEQVLRWVRKGYRRIHLVAPTAADARDTMVEGESGILTIAHPKERPLYEPSKRKLTFPNGAVALLFSAEEPERLRGPQCEAAWLDELAGWQYPQETWDQLHFGLRLGTLPQVVMTTTPKPIPLIRSLILRAQKEPQKVVLTTGSTYENRANLASTFFTQVAQYEGTRLGDQELHAKIIDPRESGIIRPNWFKLFPASAPLPKFEIILQSYDTAFTEKTQDRKTKDPDPSAQTTWGVFLIPPSIRTLYSIPNHIQYGALLLDAWTEHLSYPNLREKVQKEYRDSYYGPKGDERRADVVLIEDKGSGISLRQDLSLAVPVRPYNPGRADKVQRLHAVSNLPCQGVIFVPESRHTKGKPTDWADMVIDQVCSFPLVEHDDVVDTFSQALQYLKDQGWLVIDPPEEEDDDYVPERRAGNPYAR